jgi:hypothetical protein
MSAMIKLSPPYPAQEDLIRALQTMLEDATNPPNGRPKLIGFTGVLMYERGEYAMDIAGEVERTPEMSLAYLDVLHAILRELVRGYVA